VGDGPALQHVPIWSLPGAIATQGSFSALWPTLAVVASVCSVIFSPERAPQVLITRI
jgi:hypothetical protein